MVENSKQTRMSIMFRWFTKLFRVRNASESAVDHQSTLPFLVKYKNGFTSFVQSEEIPGGHLTRLSIYHIGALLSSQNHISVLYYFGETGCGKTTNTLETLYQFMTNNSVSSVVYVDTISEKNIDQLIEAVSHKDQRTVIVLDEVLSELIAKHPPYGWKLQNMISAAIKSGMKIVCIERMPPEREIIKFIKEDNKNIFIDKVMIESPKIEDHTYFYSEIEYCDYFKLKIPTLRKDSHIHVISKFMKSQPIEIEKLVRKISGTLQFRVNHKSRGKQYCHLSSYWFICNILMVKHQEILSRHKSFEINGDQGAISAHDQIICTCSYLSDVLNLNFDFLLYLSGYRRGNMHRRVYDLFSTHPTLKNCLHWILGHFYNDGITARFSIETRMFAIVSALEIEKIKLFYPHPKVDPSLVDSLCSMLNNVSQPIMVFGSNAGGQNGEATIAADILQAGREVPLALAAQHLDSVGRDVIEDVRLQANRFSSNNYEEIGNRLIENHLSCVIIDWNGKAISEKTVDCEISNLENFIRIHFAKNGVPFNSETLNFTIFLSINYKYSADIEVWNEKLGITPLHFAAASGNAEAFKALVAAGADIEARDENGRTPLHFVAAHGNAEAIKASVAAGADIEARDENGRTPLYFAAANAAAESFKALVAAGADIEARDENGRTPRNFATAALHHDEAMKALVMEGADIEARDAGAASVDVMPTLGESVTEATVSTWHKQVGDVVLRNERLCEISFRKETRKFTSSVKAPAAGVLAEIVAPEGATVDVGGKLAVIV